MLRTLSTIAAIAAMLCLGPVAEAHTSNGGWYQNGVGSSHRGGTYHNPTTGDHYRRQR
jgi:hypothetical protein